MSGFLRFVGSTLLFLFAAIIFFGDDINEIIPNDYQSISDDLIKHKWSLLLISIVLSIAGSITKVTSVIKKNKRTGSKLDDEAMFADNTNESPTRTAFESADSTFSEVALSKQSQFKEHYLNKTQQFANTQQGRLKETAQKVAWKPLCGGGANFKTSELKQVNSTRLEVRKSKGGLLFAGLFAAVGFATMIFGTNLILKTDEFTFTEFVPLIVGTIFSAAGIAMLIFPRSRMFDRRYGWFWSGNKSLAREQDFMKLKKSARLSDIVAIQIIDEYVSGSKSGSYSSWEINLVSVDGERLNVMDHGHKGSILADAQKLSDFLGVPIWENR